MFNQTLLIVYFLHLKQITRQTITVTHRYLGLCQYTSTQHYCTMLIVYQLSRDNLKC
jgi:hypothetical protein